MAKPVELTAKYLANVAPPSVGRVDIPDTKVTGLLYRLTASGARSWTLRYRMPGAGRAGTVQRYTIGNAADLTLADARRLAEQLRADIGKGIDPNDARRDGLAAERARPTVAQLAPRWLATVKAKLSASGYANYESAMRLYIVPKLGQLKVSDVERRHVAALHVAMGDTPSGANRTLAGLSVFMQWAEIEGARPPRSNPCFGIARYPETKRQRFLTHDELTTLGAALTTAERVGLPPSPAMQQKQGGGTIARRAKYGADLQRHPLRGKGTYQRKDKAPTITPADRYSVAAIRLMLLTGWRMAEVVVTRWSDVDLEHRVAIHRTTKAGATSRPLSAPACALLSDLPRAEGSPFVFPRAGDHSKPIGKPVRLWDAVRHAAGLNSDDKRERVVPHDLRHSVGAVAASSGASMPVIAALLGHKQVSTTERYAHLSRDARHDAADKVGAIIAAALAGNASTPEMPDPTVIPFDTTQRRAQKRATGS